MQRLGGQGGGQGGGSGGLSSLGSSLGGLNSLNGGGVLGGGTVNGSQSVLLQQMQLQQQRRLASLLQGQNELQVFKPGDTVLVEVELLKVKKPGDDQQNGQNGQNNGQKQPEQSEQPGPYVDQSGAAEQRTTLAARSRQRMTGQRIQEQPQRTIEELQAEEKQKLEDLTEQIRARTHISSTAMAGCCCGIPPWNWPG